MLKKSQEEQRKVQQEFRQEMARFSKDLEFKYDFYYKQYDGLYSFLYAIFSQSEYTKHIIKLTDGRKLTFDEQPFVKLSLTRTVKTTYEIGKTTYQEMLTETEISEFEKKINKALYVAKYDVCGKKEYLFPADKFEKLFTEYYSQ